MGLNKWIEYEIEKSRLEGECKTSEEYEEKIKELLKKLEL